MYDIKDHFKRAEIVHSRIERGICRACGKEPAMKGKQLCKRCNARKERLKAWLKKVKEHKGE